MVGITWINKPLFAIYLTNYVKFNFNCVTDLLDEHT